MAFAKSGLVHLAQGDGRSLFLYLTAADALSAVDGATYFDAAYREVGVDDVILVIASDTQRFRRVTASSASGVTIARLPSDAVDAFGPAGVTSITVDDGIVTAIG